MGRQKEACPALRDGRAVFCQMFLRGWVAYLSRFRVTWPWHAGIDQRAVGPTSKQRHTIGDGTFQNAKTADTRRPRRREHSWVASTDRQLHAYAHARFQPCAWGHVCTQLFGRSCSRCTLPEWPWCQRSQGAPKAEQPWACTARRDHAGLCQKRRRAARRFVGPPCTHNHWAAPPHMPPRTF